MDDVRAVTDAVSSHRAALLGFSEGSPMSVLFAASYPERTSHRRQLCAFSPEGVTREAIAKQLGIGVASVDRALAESRHRRRRRSA
jgi:pimeloyl-ACP methyl ester carboxylesterase